MMADDEAAGAVGGVEKRPPNSSSRRKKWTDVTHVLSMRSNGTAQGRLKKSKHGQELSPDPPPVRNPENDLFLAAMARMKLVVRENEIGTIPLVVPQRHRTIQIKAAFQNIQCRSNVIREDGVHSIRMTNVPKKIKESDIRQLFASLTPISEIILARNKRTASVSFKNELDAIGAIQMIEGLKPRPKLIPNFKRLMGDDDPPDPVPLPPEHPVLQKRVAHEESDCKKKKCAICNPPIRSHSSRSRSKSLNDDIGHIRRSRKSSKNEDY